MTEMQRHRMREVLRSYAISFSISVVCAVAMSGQPNIHPWLVAPLFGFSFGTVVTVGNLVVPQLRHRSFFVTCLMQAAVYLAVICLSFGLALWIYIAAMQGVSPVHPSVGKILARIAADPSLQGGMLGAFLVMLGISSVFQVSRKLGPGVLWHWMTGKYHEPREETRIFMFLDLKDSTTLAERLGSVRFSALVRDFFSDLTRPAIETRAEVSHYIGDEAVLTWRLDRGLNRANCIEVFFKMQERLKSRSAHYLKAYGLEPSFKAGAHLGPVVATEVGEIKSEIVYHGDVLNTSARIQGHCSELGADLLISADLFKALCLPANRHAEFKGDFLFKGKEQEIGVYAVTAVPPGVSE